MKKIVITVLLAGCLFLSGCGKKTETASDDNTSEVMQDIEDTEETKQIEEIDQTESNDLDEEMLISFRKGDKWGCMNLEGEVIIEPQYENRLDFAAGLAPVWVDGKYGYINQKNEMVVEPQYDDAREFHEGCAGVCIKKTIGDQEYEKWGFINTSGERIFELECDEIENFSEGVANVCLSGKWGYIDTTGKFVVTPRYDEATAFSDGVAVVTESGIGQTLMQREDFKTIMWNGDSNIDIVSYIMDYASCYYNGLVYVTCTEYDENEMPLYISKHVNVNGEPVVEHDYVYVGPFSEGVAVAAVQGYQYLIDTEGNTIFQTDQYNFFVGENSSTYKGMHGGMIMAEDGENYYVLNREGEILWEIPKEEDDSQIWIGIDPEKAGGRAIWHENYYPECYEYGSSYEQIAYIDENGNVLWDRRDYDY